MYTIKRKCTGIILKNINLTALIIAIKSKETRCRSCTSQHSLIYAMDNYRNIIARYNTNIH